MSLLEGKAAIVTGAGGGLGRCHALALAREGANVVVNDIGGARDGSGGAKTPADNVVEEIKAAGGNAVANYDSVGSIAGANNIVAAAVDAFGRVDIVVNNAGILRDKTLLKMDEELWDSVINVHLKGTFAVTQAAARRIAEQVANGTATGGRIVNTSSIAGLVGNFGQSNYGAAKAGIAGFTRVAAIELAKFKITVNAIVPIAKTRMTEDIAMVPESLRPECVSPLVVFLASDLAAGVSGRLFAVQGKEMREFRYKITDGANAAGEMWTPQEIASRFNEITA
jgi:NAD(P)-dependent dehydrogenase (short-subunit alcohol dehydrogenase family)